MNRRLVGSILPAFLILMMAVLACTVGQAPPGAAPTSPPPAATLQSVEITATDAIVSEDSTVAPSSPTASVVHKTLPATVAVTGQTVYDVESDVTAADKRAPYGDSYNINRFERPFLQDMTYASNLDLSTYMVGMDADWIYVSIALVGNDPNDPLGINYAVELDVDHDGFGDYIIWAAPPYPANWDTFPVKIYQDTNHNTGGLSAEKSDAPLAGDGYDKLVFSGGPGDADPDMAWVRVNNSVQGSVEFAFKRSLAGKAFMLGVMSDAGWKDPGKLDYVDRIKLEEAGSPVRDNQYYPLKALFAVDNICREAFGFQPTGYEPQLCPREEASPPPHRTPKPGVTPVGCQPPAGGCGLHYYWDQNLCRCIEIIY